MDSFKKVARLSLLCVGTALVMPVIGPGPSSAFAQSERYEQARQVVGRTQSDLERAATFLRGNKKEHERIRNAQKHLSEVDRHLAKGKFDKDTLDSAIGDIQHVLDHNVLHSEDRDVLMRDIKELREVRSDRG